MSGGIPYIAVAALLAVGSPATAAWYLITDLGELDGPASRALGVNDPGQVAGWSDVSGGATHGFLWTPASTDGVPTNPQMKDLGTLSGMFSEAHGINDGGQVVGNAQTSGGSDRAFLWTPGSNDGVPSNPQMKDLGTLGGSSSYASGVNDDAQVVGWASAGIFSHAFLWTPGGTDGVVTNPQMKDLGTLGGFSSAGYDINSGGQVAGASQTSDGNNHAFLWTPGSSDGVPTNPQMKDLGTLGGATSRAYGINDMGQVVGQSDSHAFLWTPAATDGVVTNPQMMDLGTLGGPTSYAGDINNLQQVVGWSITTGVDRRAFVWTAGSGMVNLNDVLLDGAGWTLEEALGINDRGQIVGYGVNPSAQTHAFLLTPLPGDTDGDGDVDDDDLLNVKEAFGDGGPGSIGDADGDGDSDIDDLVAVKNNHGYTPPPGLTLVPEPGGAAMAVGLGLALWNRRARS